MLKPSDQWCQILIKSIGYHLSPECCICVCELYALRKEITALPGLSIIGGMKHWNGILEWVNHYQTS